MWNKKYLQPNEDLQNLNQQVLLLNEQVKILSWRLDNPPKYKKGDGVLDFTIIDEECIYQKRIATFPASVCRKYQAFHKIDSTIEHLYEGEIERMILAKSAKQ